MEIPIYFGWILIFILWFSPAVLLWKIPKGKKIYFINLILGILFVFAGILLLAARPNKGTFDFGTGIGNAMRALIIVYAWLAWGLILLGYSVYRRYLSRN